MGSAWDAKNITRQLELYHEAGMGGVHLIPIYGAKGYEDRYIDYLSPEWLDMLAHTTTEAARLGLWVDMTTGTGWNFGGPGITGDLACASVGLKTIDITRNTRPPIDLKVDWARIQALVAVNQDGQSIELMDHIVPRGKLSWHPPEGKWRLYLVSQRPTNKEVERAAPGGVGVMLNPYYGTAVQYYLERFDKAFDRYEAPMPRAMYHDSFEYNNDWSPDFFEEFEIRRGYRLQQQLPDFFAKDGGDTTARIKCDYRETVSDLVLEHFIRPWAGWAQSRGCLTRNQAHGSPGNLLDLYGAVDIPETEMFNKDRDPLIAKFASSAAHTMGRKRVAAEFGTWLKDHFNVRLADLKDLVDELFLSGVNQVLYHGTTYSPEEDPWPGWLFYASTQMNPRNAIWHDVRAFNDYIARCQAVLQHGTSDNDILIYWPIHDMWQDAKGRRRDLTVHHTEWFTEQPIGEVARGLWKRGYTFDYVSDRQLQLAVTENNRIRMPGGAYRVLLVPPCQHIPLETMERLISLAESGATILFTGQLPQDVPGLADLAGRRMTLKHLLSEIPWNEDQTEATVGKGSIRCGKNVEQLLTRVGVVRETLADIPGLFFLRRAHDDGRYYFIANRAQDAAFDAWLPLAASAESVLIMDPMSGQTGLAATRTTPGNTTEAFLQLTPGQAVILKVFSHSQPAAQAWTYYEEAGRPLDITGRWKVDSVQGGPNLPASFKTDTLASWTELGDAEAKRFAGTARYTMTFDLPEESADSWRIDLGRVAESARVRLNGADLGVIFTPPFRVISPSELLKPTSNRLEVEVTNLSANRIRDLDRRGVEWRKFYDINFVNIDYKPFDASNWPLRDSGLLGPVQLIPMRIRSH